MRTRTRSHRKDEWLAKRRRAIAVAWILVLAAIGGLIASRMVAPQKIDDTHIWLKGPCDEFLAPLPEWPRDL